MASEEGQLSDWAKNDPTIKPGATELCNTVDDDCDTKVDEDFKNLSGVYNQNTHCGSCATDCTVLYALPNATGVVAIVQLAATVADTARLAVAPPSIKNPLVTAFLGRCS